MTIYRRAGLFLSSLQTDGSELINGVPVPELNSAIISATFASHSVSNLKDRVKLIFRPVKVSAYCYETLNMLALKMDFVDVLLTLDL